MGCLQSTLMAFFPPPPPSPPHSSQRPSPPHSSSPQSPPPQRPVVEELQTGATHHVNNLRERGVLAYKRAAAMNDPAALALALQLFRRAAAFDAPSIPPALRASAQKNVLACHKLRLQRAVAASITPPLPDTAFHTDVAEACAAFRGAVAASDAHPARWRLALESQYLSYIALVTYVASCATPPSPSRIEKHLLRVQLLRRTFAATQPSQPTVSHEFHYRLATALHDASAAALATGDGAAAVAHAASSEGHVRAMDDAAARFATNQRALRDIEQVTNLRRNVDAQQRAAAATQQIARARDILEQMDMCDEVGEEQLFPVIDALKEAQVGARDSSPIHEAEACTLLAPVYREFRAVRNACKEASYVHRAFALLNTMDTSDLHDVEWVVDARAAYVRVRGEEQREEAERRARARENVEKLMERIRFKLKLIDEEKEGLRFLYESYPPKSGRVPEAKLQRDDVSGAIKIALLHYHPDRNPESVYGIEYALVCEEITKSLNLLKQRMENGWESDISS
ncbi:hypothetical protein FGB62_108g09 [Gracilaria domingensis]|nr:hypothetical protein FGB62_108g09 [Gracilaria domingensis]